MNRSYLPAGAEPITKVTVSRYCISHGMTDMERNDIAKAVVKFDPLTATSQNLSRIDRHASKLANLIDTMKDDEEKLSEIASISNAYVNALKQKQTLIESVTKVQAEQLRVDKVKKAMAILIEVLGKYPEVKAEFFQRLREHENYDLIRNL